MSLCRLSSTSAVSALAVAPDDSNRIYSGSSDNELWMSIDFGKMWRRIDTGLPTSGGIILKPVWARVWLPRIVPEW